MNGQVHDTVVEMERTDNFAAALTPYPLYTQVTCLKNILSPKRLVMFMLFTFLIMYTNRKMVEEDDDYSADLTIKFDPLFLNVENIMLMSSGLLECTEKL